MFASLMALAMVGLAVWCWWVFLGPTYTAPVSEPDTVSTAIDNAAAANDATTSPATLPGPLKPPAASADGKTKIQAAKDYVDLKNYPMAEDLYKQVLDSEPTNLEALQGLASVLYREDKIDEAAAILDRIPK
jgi:predicted negative regulator of RcsB-dependent stress response